MHEYLPLVLMFVFLCYASLNLAKLKCLVNRTSGIFVQLIRSI